MRKNILALCSLIALLVVAPLSFANTDTNSMAGKFTVEHGVSTGKPLTLSKKYMYGSEVLVINNTSEVVSVDVPYLGISDWIYGEGYYRITSSLILPTLKVTTGHPLYGYIDSWVSSHSIISYSIRFGSAKVITVDYGN